MTSGPARLSRLLEEAPLQAGDRREGCYYWAMRWSRMSYSKGARVDFDWLGRRQAH